MAEERALSTRFLIGTGWMVATRWGVRLIGLVSTIMLARLLTPEDFGLVAAGMALFVILEKISQSGFGAALVRFQDATRADYDTAFTYKALIGFGIAGGLLALADPFASFMEDDRLSQILTALSVIAALKGLENIKFVDFEKALQFRPTFIADVTIKILSVTTGVTLAFLWGNYWALIAGMTMSAIGRLCISYVMIPYRPRICFSSTRKLFGFGGWLTGASILSTINQRFDNIILYKLMSATAVGYFFMAKEVSYVSVQEVAGPVQKVLFPTLSTLTNNPGRIRQVYFESNAVMVALMMPAAIGMALVAEDLVAVALGERWLPSVPVMEILALMLSMRIMGMNMTAPIKASGQTRLLFIRTLLYLPVRPVLFFLGAYYYGLTGAAVGFALSGVFLTFVDFSLVNKVVGSRMVDHFACCWRSIAATAVMAAAVLTLQDATAAGGIYDVPNYLRLGLSVILGASVYAAAHAFLWQIAGRPHGPETRGLDIARKALAGRAYA